MVKTQKKKLFPMINNNWKPFLKEWKEKLFKILVSNKSEARPEQKKNQSLIKIFLVNIISLGYRQNQVIFYFREARTLEITPLIIL